MNQNENNRELKKFFIKLISVVLALIIIINVSYNLIVVDKVKRFIDKDNIEVIKEKIRLEIKNGLEKENILNEEDRILLQKFYLKIKNELDEAKKL